MKNSDAKLERKLDRIIRNLDNLSRKNQENKSMVQNCFVKFEKRNDNSYRPKS